MATRVRLHTNTNLQTELAGDDLVAGVQQHTQQLLAPRRHADDAPQPRQRPRKLATKAVRRGHRVHDQIPVHPETAGVYVQKHT